MTTMHNDKSSNGLFNDLILLNFEDENLFSKVLEQMKKYIDFDAATLYAYNSDKEQLNKIQSFGQDVEILTGIKNEFGSGISGWSAESSQTILLSDRTKKKNFNPDTDFATFLSVPILRNKSLFGVVNLGSSTINKFTEEHVHCIESAAPILSYILNHFTILSNYNEIRKTYFDTVEKLQELQNQQIPTKTTKNISNETSLINHDINNYLSIILGNVQCLLIGASEINQKSLSRLKRIESAAKKISESNNRIVSLNTLVNQDSDEVTIKN